MVFLRMLLAWLAVLEIAFRRRKWHGLVWLAEAPASLLMLLIGVLVLYRRPRNLVRATILTGPLALLLQVGLASLRNLQLNPLNRLAPGDYPDRTIMRVDIPMPEGSMPALYLVPCEHVHGAVLVLHGSGCDKTYYAWRLADTLIAHDMAVLLVDLDGHGESERIQRYAETLENATIGVDWLRKRHQQVGLIGVSLGGCLAARAVADGLAVAGLALLEAPPYLWFTREHMMREAFSLRVPFLRGLFGESTAYYLGYTIYDLVRVQSGPRIRASIGTIDLIEVLGLITSLPKITAPLLLVYGGNDAIVRRDQAAQILRVAPPQAVFLLVPEASHLSLILHPGALARLGEWMQACMRT